MNNEVVREAQELVLRSETAGRTANEEEMITLKEKMGGKFPAWLMKLMNTIPVYDSLLAIPIENEDFDIEINFLNSQLIIEETFLAVPGCAVFEEGYICIGLIRSLANPIAINIYEGNNPPVYILDHDYGEDTELIIENRQMIAESLSELFSFTILKKEAADW